MQSEYRIIHYRRDAEPLRTLTTGAKEFLATLNYKKTEGKEERYENDVDRVMNLMRDGRIRDLVKILSQTKATGKETAGMSFEEALSALDEEPLDANEEKKQGSNNAPQSLDDIARIKFPISEDLLQDQQALQQAYQELWILEAQREINVAGFITDYIGPAGAMLSDLEKGRYVGPARISTMIGSTEPRVVGFAERFEEFLNQDKRLYGNINELYNKVKADVDEERELYNKEIKEHQIARDTAHSNHDFHTEKVQAGFIERLEEQLQELPTQPKNSIQRFKPIIDLSNKLQHFVKSKKLELDWLRELSILEARACLDAGIVTMAASLKPGSAEAAQVQPGETPATDQVFEVAINRIMAQTADVEKPSITQAAKKLHDLLQNDFSMMTSFAQIDSLHSKMKDEKEFQAIESNRKETNLIPGYLLKIARSEPLTREETAVFESALNRMSAQSVNNPAAQLLSEFWNDYAGEFTAIELRTTGDVKKFANTGVIVSKTHNYFNSKTINDASELLNLINRTETACHTALAVPKAGVEADTGVRVSLAKEHMASITQTLRKLSHNIMPTHDEMQRFIVTMTAIDDIAKASITLQPLHYYWKEHGKEWEQAAQRIEAESRHIEVEDRLDSIFPDEPGAGVHSASRPPHQQPTPARPHTPTLP